MLNEALFFQSVSLGGQEITQDRAQAVRSAMAIYRQFQANGWVFRTLSAFTRQRGRLMSLKNGASDGVTNAYYAGPRTVDLAMVRGSESRSADFDAGFHPLRFEDRGRWLSLATAWLMGVPLPQVELIEMGGIYYVRDGHHRISVARALGQMYIDAVVTVWK